MLTLIKKSNCPSVPWKNGGGTTQELFKMPHPSADKFLFRISVAQVQSDGPFSKFEGIQRHLALLAGKGLSLKFADHVMNLHTLQEVIRFSGEEEIHCSLLEGSCVDFNVMFDSSLTCDTLLIQKKQGEIFSLPASQNMVFVYEPVLEQLWVIQNETFQYSLPENRTLIKVSIEYA